MKLFCFGLGYVAHHLVNALSSSSWQYSGTNRSSGELIFTGLSPMKNAATHLEEVTHLLISISPNDTGQDPVFLHHKEFIKNMPNLKWIGYLSATSVYGNHNGGWVDENTEPTPSNCRGKNRLVAESKWRSLNLPVHIFRLGGIYGPARNQIAAVQNNLTKKIIKPNHTFSRIHVDDIVGALLKSIENPNPGAIYNIVDDHPTSAAEVLDYICHIMEKPIIAGTPIDDANVSATLKSFYSDNKRVSNRQTKKELNWQLKFPSYQEGYQDILGKLNQGLL